MKYVPEITIKLQNCVQTKNDGVEYSNCERNHIGQMRSNVFDQFKEYYINHIKYIRPQNSSIAEHFLFSPEISLSKSLKLTHMNHITCRTRSVLINMKDRAFVSLSVRVKVRFPQRKTNCLFSINLSSRFLSYCRHEIQSSL